MSDGIGDNFDAAMDAYAEERAAYDATNDWLVDYVLPFTGHDLRGYLAANRRGPDRLELLRNPLRVVYVSAPTVPSWGEIEAHYLDAVDAAIFADSEAARDVFDTLDGDGTVLSCGEYRYAHDHYVRYAGAVTRRAILQGRLGAIIERSAHTSHERTPKQDRRLRAACNAAVVAVAEWARDPDRDSFGSGSVSPTPERLARLADVARNLLVFAEVLAREAGANDLADELARLADAVAWIVAVRHALVEDDEPVRRPPVHRTLAPPGRSITVQPHRPNGPPVASSTGCSDAPLAA